MKKILLSVICVLGLGSVVLFYCWPMQLNDGGFSLIDTKLSPSGSKVAEVHAYRGGATVKGFSVLLVRPVGQKLSPDDIGTRVADSEGPAKLIISWESDEKLFVQFPSAEHRLMKSVAFGVAIEEHKTE